MGTHDFVINDDDVTTDVNIQTNHAAQGQSFLTYSFTMETYEFDKGCHSETDFGCN